MEIQFNSIQIKINSIQIQIKSKSNQNQNQNSIIFIYTPAFGGAGSVRGNTGPFWIASGLCVVGALVSVFFVHPLTQEGIEREDREFRAYLEMHGYDTRRMGTGTGTGTGTVGGSSSASASASGTGSSDGNGDGDEKRGDEGEKRGDEGEKAV
ncbi:hypothetical protein E4T56_gene4080 [Termitomyces sp. T112]|nr:hypothetical protein E4T56_gene4080 [Termitomyces sp. T112]